MKVDERTTRKRCALRLLFAAALCLSGIYLWSLAFPIRLPQPDVQGHFVTSFMRYRASGGTIPAATWIDLDEVPKVVVCAVIKAEDRGFFHHRGVDWRSMFKAARQAAFGGPLIGASTISQQLARNLFVTPERSLQRKLVELWYTFRIEQRLSKRELIELYLNAVEWDDGVWGIERASSHYFGVTPAQLGLQGSLFLASKIANPLGKAEGEELNRMETVYLRVNGQLFRSGIIDAAARDAAMVAWQQYRRNVNERVTGRAATAVFLSGPPAPVVESKDCGFASE